MKKIVILVISISGIHGMLFAQDMEKIRSAVSDYVEGFYDGDTTKIIRSINPDLSKRGYGINDETGEYKTHIMTYERAIGFARDVMEKPEYAAPEGAVRKIEILDAQDKIACVKLTAYWGIDYLLLAKYENKWMVTKVLWQSLPDD